MLILGLLLIVVAAVVFGYMFWGTDDLAPLDIDLGVFTVQLTPLHLYLLGAATLVVLVLGLLALATGLRASRRRRKEVKELRKAVHDGGTDYGRRTNAREPVAAPVEQPVRDQRRANDPAPYEREVPRDDARYQRDVSSDPQVGRSDDPEIALPSDYQGGDPDGSARDGDGTRR